MGLARRVQGARATALRLGAAAVLTALLMAAAYGGLFVTTASEPISLLLEPFSLLLMPGLLVALAIAGQHDFSAVAVLVASAIFYFVFFFAVLHWWAYSRRADASSG